MTLSLVVAASPLQEKTKRSGKREFGGGSPRQPNQALRRRSRAQWQAGVLRSVQRSTASAATIRNASQGVCACICFQRSAHTARTAVQCEALHSAQRCTSPSAVQCPALHCAQRYTAPSVAQCAAFYSPPLSEPCIARSIIHRPALHCTEHSEPRQGRMQQPNHRLHKGGCCVFFVRLAPMKTAVRTPELAPCAKNG